MNWLPRLVPLLFLGACVPPPSTSDLASEASIAFSVPGGSVTLSSVMWTISQGTTIVAAGTIDTRMPNAQPSFDALVPVGTGYTISLTGTASNGAACSGSSNFDVVGGVTTDISLALTCVTQTVTTSGAVDVKTVVSSESCPDLTGYDVSPTTQNVGQQIDVTSVVATDADGDTLTYAWTESGGPGALTIVNPSTTMPSVTCAAAGAVTLVLGVSDNHTPTGCTVTQTVNIDCL
jgi:hypothetical protein